MAQREVFCHACGAGLRYDGTLARSERCRPCGADLRCCRSCRHYDPSHYNECREPSAERVLEKDRANFCDYFAPAAARDAAAAGDDAGSSTLSDLERLFRKG